MAVVMKGKEIAKQLKADIEREVELLNREGIRPTLAAIRVGDKADAINYENSTIKWLSKLNIGCETFHYDEFIKKSKFLGELEKISDMENIHGMLIFRPLPKGLDTCDTDYAIRPIKDVDGMNPLNFGKVCIQDKSGYAPCTAEAVMEILKFHGINIAGKNVVILGRSLVIGKPVSMLLINEGATVTVCNSKTKNLPKVCRRADILVSAIGKPNFVNSDFVRKDAIVIDVGINVLSDGKVTGDVDYDDVEKRCSYITPVPGGVGSVTNAVLAKHIVKAAKLLNM
ncbi:bifunctional 5,10-methylenetetrahydrofolate dehydrogenase/5,10-methenyltetrahydrofolate cyclohydrolase [Tyzzerella sp. OttesenSCG-928-J15]|nr:bifunctional 5,10-methylenetetrahydrofolate dehydrogenase/5,10-methenyltetrahydrofolate cyclohydrolase [Tyzzerella sp. OttesenSCG-928-J15]